MIRRKWLIRTALAVVVSLIVRTLWLVGNREWQRAAGERELAAAVAATEVSDPLWSWESLVATRQIPKPEQNGAAIIPRVKSLLPKEWAGHQKPMAWEQAMTAQPPNLKFTQTAISPVRRELETAKEAVNLARTLRNYPNGNRTLQLAPDVLSTRLDDTQQTRMVASLLRWDIVLAVADHDTDRASDDALALLNASRSIGDEPFLISQLVRIAVRSIAGRSTEWMLAQVSLSEPQLAALQAAWAHDAEEPLLLYGLRGERAAYDTFLRNLADGTITPSSLTGEASGSFEGYAWWLYRGRFPREQAFYHRYLTQAVDAARLPAHEQVTAIRSLPDSPGEEMRIVPLLLPAVEKVAASSRRSIAEARCVLVGLACERYRLRFGQWPARLDDLATDLLNSVPLDPFDGQPLRYKVQNGQAVVYSIGDNGKDDDGDTPHAGKSGSLDLGIRLWRPEDRQLNP